MAFCIYLHYLCVILKFVWWSESFQYEKYCMQKNKNQEEGIKHFHGTVAMLLIANKLKLISAVNHETMMCYLLLLAGGTKAPIYPF